MISQKKLDYTAKKTAEAIKAKKIEWFTYNDLFLIAQKEVSEIKYAPSTFINHVAPVIKDLLNE